MAQQILNGSFLQAMTRREQKQAERQRPVATLRREHCPQGRTVRSRGR